LRKFVKARLTFRISDFWVTKTTVSWLFEAIRQTGTSSRRETLNPKRAGYEAHIESLKRHIKNGKRDEMKKPSEGVKKILYGPAKEQCPEKAFEERHPQFINPSS